MELLLFLRTNDAEMYEKSAQPNFYVNDYVIILPFESVVEFPKLVLHRQNNIEVTQQQLHLFANYSSIF